MKSSSVASSAKEESGSQSSLQREIILEFHEKKTPSDSTFETDSSHDDLFGDSSNSGQAVLPYCEAYLNIYSLRYEGDLSISTLPLLHVWPSFLLLE